MADPITVGNIIAFAASEALKTGVGEAVKDAYWRLKEKLRPSAAAEIAALEKDPNSKGRQAVVAEIIDRQSEQERNNLRVLAETLVIELKKHNPSIAFDFRNLTNVDVVIEDIAAKSGGVGARIERMTGGKIEVKRGVAEGQSGN